jgi:hypothetical protein
MRFRIFKFRTMRTDANPYDHSPVGDIDPRITRVGRVLRVGGIDELPQLINVLRGDMSMVGPRPEMPFIVDTYTELQKQRLAAKPGITGLWQLGADRHSEIHENIEYDLYYINHQSLLLDGLILVETAFFTSGVVLRGLHQWLTAKPKTSLRRLAGGDGAAATVPARADTANGVPSREVSFEDMSRDSQATFGEPAAHA